MANESVGLPVTFTRPHGSGVVRDLTLAPWERRSIVLANEPGWQGDADVSVAV